MNKKQLETIMQLFKRQQELVTALQLIESIKNNNSRTKFSNALNTIDLTQHHSDIIREHLKILLTEELELLEHDINSIVVTAPREL